MPKSSRRRSSIRRNYRTVAPIKQRRRVYRKIDASSPSYVIKSSLPRLQAIRPALIVRRADVRQRTSPQIPHVFLPTPGHHRSGVVPRFAKHLRCLKRRQKKKTMMKQIAAQVKAGGGSLTKWRANRRRNQQEIC